MSPACQDWGVLTRALDAWPDSYVSCVADCRCCTGGPSRLGQPSQDPAVQPASKLCPGNQHLLGLCDWFPRGTPDSHPSAVRQPGYGKWRIMTCPGQSRAMTYP